MSLVALKALFWNLIFQRRVRMLRENKGVKKAVSRKSHGRNQGQILCQLISQKPI